MTLSQFRSVVLWLTVVATVIDFVTCDVTGTTPPAESCFCPSTNNLLVRDSACGEVIDTRGINQCFTYTGRKASCTLDIEYEFFEIKYVGETTTGWVVGNYVNLEPKGYCTVNPCGVIQPGSGADVEFDSRIIGGSDATPKAWPWQLAVETLDADAGAWALSCGAVLISAQWAITAAHCVDNIQHPIRITAGVYRRSDPVSSEQERFVDASAITLHPEYNPNDRLLNDIALIYFSTAYDLSTAAIRNICLPPRADMMYYENPQCYITGWGITEAGGTTNADTLQRAGIEVIKPLNCELYTERPTRFSELCVLDQGPRTASVCGADLGGPLSCLSNTRFQLAGVGSTSDCNFRQPQVFSNIPYYLEWIRQITGVVPL